MVKVTIGEREVYIDNQLKSNLDICKNVVNQDWDMFFIVDGLEGAGKSVLAQQIGAYLDPSLNIDRICFNPDDFKEAILSSNKKQCIIYDEAFRGLSSRNALSEVNQAMNLMFAEIRQKNLFVIIVLPCFFELDKYPALWRSRLLFHVYDKHFQRGFFSVYNIDRKKYLYVLGKKFYEYKASPNIIGRFTKWYWIDEQAYKDKKLKALQDHDPTNVDNSTAQRDKLINYLVEKYECKKKDIAEQINLTVRRVQIITQKKKEKKL